MLINLSKYIYYSNNFYYCQYFRNNISYNLGMEFRSRLKELRAENNESQQQLGSVLNMSKMAISHWESGHGEPSIAQLIAIANHFDVSVDYLIGRDDRI